MHVLVMTSLFKILVSADCLVSLTAQRHFGETNMNVNSSRSHTIFRMVSSRTASIALLMKLN